jgi:hypothetical protein
MGSSGKFMAKRFAASSLGSRFFNLNTAFAEPRYDEGFIAESQANQLPIS